MFKKINNFFFPIERKVKTKISSKNMQVLHLDAVKIDG